jgi:hypothetical protein
MSACVYFIWATWLFIGAATRKYIHTEERLPEADRAELIQRVLQYLNNMPMR